jgi:hypothetical protein
MKSLLIVLLFAIALTAFPTIKISNLKQRMVQNFWNSKKLEEVSPMPIPMLNEKNELVEDIVDKYYSYFVQNFDKNITKSTSPVPRNLYPTHPYKYAGKLLFQTSRGQSSW